MTDAPFGVLVLTAAQGIVPLLILVGAVGVMPLAATTASARGAGLLCAAIAVAAYLIVGSVAIPIAMATVVVALVIRERRSGRTIDTAIWPFARECAVVLGGLAVYTALRLIESEPEPAFANGAHVISFERALGLYFEPDLQRWVLSSDVLTRAFNWLYSFAFLAMTSGALLWLWFVDRPRYLLLRNCLGISALLAILTIWVFPVAPPRLIADSGMVDTVVLFGREHSFANEYAAIPSLHVGWMAAVGLALGLSIGGRRGLMIGLLPATVTALTVVATGNHLWLDGVVGVAYAMAGAALVSEPAASRIHAAARALWTTLRTNQKAQYSIVSLGMLLAYLVFRQVFAPGFTDYWGYLAAQVGLFLVILIAAEVLFPNEGGFSWPTHVIVSLACYADVLGTDGDLYATFDEYDKLTHFAGVAALTAAIYDVMRVLYLRRVIDWASPGRLLVSVALGMALGVGWEVYETIGDHVFNTARVGGVWDTTNDLISDSFGAISAALVLWIGETRLVRRRAEAGDRSAADAPMSQERQSELA